MIYIYIIYITSRIHVNHLSIGKCQWINHAMMTSSNGNIFRVIGPLCGWVINRETGDLKRHRAHYDAIVMQNMGIIGYWQKTPKYTKYNKMRNMYISLRWHHNERDDVSKHQRLDCLLNRLLRRRSKKASKHRVTALCDFHGRFPLHSNSENVSICWCHPDFLVCTVYIRNEICIPDKPCGHSVTDK